MAGRYFEEFKEGEEILTPSRTVTETDLVMFAAMSGDYNELHTSEEFMKGSRFGRRIGHGLLGLALSHGLMFRTGITENTVISLMSVDSWKFLAPFYIGDTVHVKLRVTETRPSRSRSDLGFVKLSFELVNQKGEVIQSGVKTFGFKRRV
ncbi:MAG: dehydratase [Deltaproteobacteria bacterium HGW-Deltaproteobacteria-21]|nr:MAG: dehydratase [Deltaproteobacteria bacterium HGW-Deltaproteobacteria-21]